MSSELVSLGVEIPTALTGEHRVQVAGELVGLETLRAQSFILTALTGQQLSPLILMDNQMFLKSRHGRTFSIAAEASLLVRNVILDMKEELGQLLRLKRTTVADM